MEKKNKKKLLLPLFLLLLLVGVGGTVAWLTSTNTVTNNFTVGSFTEPTTDPKDATQAINKVNRNFDGNLYERTWDTSADHKLLPGVEFAKDPYVGIGPGSEDAVVYMYVKNNISDKVYFTINNGWEAVDGETTAGSTTGTYKEGLFKYTEVLVAGENDSWTTEPLFSKVVVSEDADNDDFGTGENTTIVVKSFLHQAKDSEGNPIDAATILSAAKTAFELE